jgi:CheY-like chemotaxis protein
MNETRSAAHRGERPPILLVEDNPMDVDLTLRAFSKRQCAHPILVARDGEEALSWLPRWSAGEPMPAVVLLDIQLPRLNGLEVLQAFKRDAQARRVPVVVLTSSRDDRDLGSAYDLGANSYIEKPVSFSKFIEVAEHIETYWCGFNERAYRP